VTPGWAAVRAAANLATGGTLLGLVVARAGGAVVAPGPHRLLLAGGYRLRFPAAAAFTVGNVVVSRLPVADLVARRTLLAHEARHATQWAWLLGLPFLPAYLAASGWSWLRTGDPATANVFERRAGLAAGGYPAPRGAGSRPTPRVGP
jgi:hypothetical protein